MTTEKKVPEKKVFVIDRATWRCGGGSEGVILPSTIGKGDTRMLNDEGFMCCLGQICQQIGANVNHLSGAGDPQEVGKAVLETGENDVLDQLVKFKLIMNFDYEDPFIDNTDLTDEAIDINDNLTTTKAEKEEALIALFDQYDMELKFKGRAVKPKKVSKLPDSEQF